MQRWSPTAHCGDSGLEGRLHACHCPVVGIQGLLDLAALALCIIKILASGKRLQGLENGVEGVLPFDAEEKPTEVDAEGLGEPWQHRLRNPLASLVVSQRPDVHSQQVR